jgi:hypothetical protein
MWRAVTAMAGLLLCCASAQAAPRSGCCFKITLSVSGGAHLTYSRDSPSDDAGTYGYVWKGAAYGIAHIQGSALVTDRGVATGSLEEINGVKRSDGSLRNDADPNCVADRTTVSGQRFGKVDFEKAEAGYPDVTTGRHGGVIFSRSLDAYELICGSMATDAADLLAEDNPRWSSPRDFFGFHQITGPSIGKLANRETQEIDCVEQAHPAPKGRLAASGSWALTIRSSRSRPTTSSASSGA